MTEPEDTLSALPLAVQLELEQRIEQFEKALQAGAHPAFEDFLPPEGSPGRRLCLIELVHADLNYRLHAGEPVRVEQYLAAHPLLGQKSAVVLELLRQEYEVRRKWEPNLAPQEYQARFPELMKDLPTFLKTSPGALPAEPASPPGTVELPRPGERPDRGPVDAEPPVPKIPGYDVSPLLGRGGMGVVYLARHRELNRQVALKLLLAGVHSSVADVTRFLSEAEAVAALHHANIVQVFEVGRYQGMPFMALEYVAGGSLAQKLKGGPLSPRQAARLVEQMARGLNAAHQAGIVHRDLKPANVLLTEEGTPKITDFGLAKRVASGGRQSAVAGLTQTGAIMGTPSYMAPEQASGEGKRVGPAADVYALGAVLYECLTGRPPFQAANSLEILVQVISREPVAPSQLQPKVPRDLETICLKCLHKEPLKRYASAEALAEDLRRWQAHEPILARPVGRLERLTKWVRRRPTAAALVTVCVLALATLFAGGLYFQSQLREEVARAEKAAVSAITARSDLQKVNTALLQSQEALQTSNDQLLTSVARSLLRPLGVQIQANQEAVSPLSDPEIEVLWELASSPEPKLRLRFIEEALRKPVFTRQLNDRAELALQAVVGLDPARRQQVVQLLVQRWEAQDVAAEQRLHIALTLAWLGGQDADAARKVFLAITEAMDREEYSFASGPPAQGLKLVAAWLGPGDAKTAAAVLTRTLSKSGTVPTARKLAQSLAAVAARLEPKEAAVVCNLAANKLTLEMCVAANPWDLHELAQGLTAVAPWLEPGDAKTAAGRLTWAMDRAAYPAGVRELAQGLAAVAVGLKPKEAAALCHPAVTILSRAMDNPPNASALRELSQGLVAVAAYLEPADAREAAAALTRAMNKPAYMPVLRELAQGLAAVAARLEPKEAATVCRAAAAALVQQATSPRTGTKVYVLGSLPQGFALVAARLEPADAKEVAAILARAMDKATDEVYLSELAHALAAVAARLEPKEAAAVCSPAAARLTEAINEAEHAVELAPLAQGLAAVVARLETKEAAAVCRSAAAKLTAAMDKTEDTFTLGELAQGLAAVAVWLEPKEAAAVCRPALPRLTRAMSKPANVARLRELAQGLAAVAAYLESGEAKEVAAVLTRAMEKARLPSHVRELARGLVAVAARMEPKGAAAILTQEMTKTINPSALQSLAQGLSAVAARLEPKEAATVRGQAAATLTQAMSKTTDPDELQLLAQGLSAVLADLHTAEQQQRTGAIMAVLAGPADGFASLGRWPLLLPALEPLPCRLSDQQLVNLLKHPLCVGEARRVLLDQLGNRHHRRFEDQWAFVHYAQEHHLGLDFTSPPQRPGNTR